MAPGEVGQEARPGPGEGVDGLRGVADDADVAAVPPPQREQRLLQRAHVLVLVDHQVPVGAADGVGDLGVVRHQRGGAQQDVLEVDPAAVALGVLVAGEDPGDRLRLERGDAAVVLGGEPGIVLGADVAHLGPADLRHQVAQPRRVDPDPQPAGGLGHQRHPVVQHAGQLAAVDLRPEVLRLAQRGGVERPGLDTPGAELLQPARAAPPPRGW